MCSADLVLTRPLVGAAPSRREGREGECCTCRRWYPSGEERGRWGGPTSALHCRVIRQQRWPSRVTPPYTRLAVGKHPSASLSRCRGLRTRACGWRRSVCGWCVGVRVQFGRARAIRLALGLWLSWWLCGSPQAALRASPASILNPGPRRAQAQRPGIEAQPQILPQAQPAPRPQAPRAGEGSAGHRVTGERGQG